MKKIIISIFAIFNFAFTYAQCTNLHDFMAGTDGGIPRGSLISDGIFLYGMTQSGGINNTGTIFKIMPDGSGYTKLFDFGDTLTGSYAFGSLTYDSGFLYGMANDGGANSKGTIFKIMPDGSGFVNLLDFAGLSNGSYPYGDLYSDGTFLYGMTSEGGTNNFGTVFKIHLDGSGFITLFNFASTVNGYSPTGSLISDGTFLYGMTEYGGINDMGTIFKIMPDGTGFVKLLDFAGNANGDSPFGSLIKVGAFLYGMTASGGINDMGCLFKIMPDGSGYVKLLDFTGLANGSIPDCSLITDGAFLYGMTNAGGANNKGTIFRVMTDGSGYAKLLDFDGTLNGSYPQGSLISDGTFLYGMTQDGGTSGFGTIFKYDFSTANIQENTIETQLDIYPNPTTGKLNIVCENEQKDARLEILNTIGQSILCIKKINLQAGENYVIDVASLENGAYILRFNGYQKIILKN